MRNAFGNWRHFDIDDSSDGATTIETGYVVKDEGPGLIVHAVTADAETQAFAPVIIDAAHGWSAPASDGSGPQYAPGTLQQLADYLKSGYWDYVNGAGGGAIDWKWGITNISFNVSALTATEQDLAREAFHAFARVCNLTFTEVASGGNIVFSSPAAGGAFATFGGSGSTITSATVSISDAWMSAHYNAAKPYYNYAFQTYIQEIGHALGLGHLGPYNTSAVYGVDNIFDNDSWQLSVMSRINQDDNTYAGLNGSFAYVSSLMQADILALQDKYGAPVGNQGHWFGYGPTATGNGFNSGTGYGARSFTMYANDGYVWLDTSNYTGSQTIDMRSGKFSSIYGYTDNVSQYNSHMTRFWGSDGSDDVTLSYYGTTVFTGGGNDYLRSGGTLLGDELAGYSGNTLDGGAGFDTLFESSFRSSYTFQHTSQSNNGWTISSSSTLDKLANIEIVQFSDTTAVNLRADARTDLTADGSSDIVWYNKLTGAVNYWDMDYGAVSSWNLAGVVNWTARGSGDLNGDGNSDILFQRNSDGAIGFLKNVSGTWSWQGAGLVSWQWFIAAITDTNNDGIADIVYRNPDLGGAMGVLTMDSSGVGSWSGAGIVGTGWTAVGSGDTNFDGRSEVIFWNGALGVTGSYDTNGTWRSIGTAISPDWTVGGVGDFDANGTHDVLMYNSALGGALGFWKMDYNGNAVWTGIAGIGAIGAAWTPEATGDYDNDGDTDILFYNDAFVAAGYVSLSTSGGVTTGTWVGLGAVNESWQIL